MNTHPSSIDIAIGFSQKDFGECLRPGERTTITAGFYEINGTQKKGTFLIQHPTNKESLELFFPNATPDNIKTAITAAGLPLNKVANHANTYFTGEYAFT